MITKLEESKVADLRHWADEHAVEYDESDTKGVLINKLTTDGVTVDMVNALIKREDDAAKAAEDAKVAEDAKAAESAKEAAPQPAPVHNDPPTDIVPAATKDDYVLLLMTRANPTFQAYGHTFTKKAPFQLVSSAVADRIMKTFDGFRPAAPHEARDYYSL